MSAELIRRGHRVEIESWSDASVLWENADVVLIRSTWDYHRRLAEFVKWAARVPNLFNPLKTIEWNASKRYLAGLADLPIVASHFAGGAKAALGAADRLLAIEKKIVLKPTVSATAELTFVAETRAQAADAIAQILVRGEVVLQPFVSSIATDGELLLIFSFKNGEWIHSHSILKSAKSGDFRVQSEFGGSSRSVEASAPVIALARKTLAAANASALYARVDIVDWKVAPKIGEPEMIEPELFFRFSPKAVEQFADAIEAL